MGDVPWINGVKTGYTAGAGYVLVGSGTQKGVTLLSVVMGAPSMRARDHDTLALLRYGFSLYRRRAVIRPDQSIAQTRVPNGERGLALVAARAVRATLRRGERPTVAIDAPAATEAPIRRGERIGHATVTLDGQPIGRTPLLARYSVDVAPESLAARVDDALPGPRAVVWALAVAVLAALGRRGRRGGQRSSSRLVSTVKGVEMILTVTLNAAIDRTVAVPNFRLGRRHRAVESRTVAGGKGVNVARALKLLGRPVIVTGLAGGGTGSRIKERLTEESILHHFTEIEGESRTNLAVIDPTSGEQTEINERGPEVRPDEVDAFIEKLLYLAQGASLCVLAGSIPPGVDASVYGRLIVDLERLGVPAVLDTDGDPMRLGMRAEPAVVAPNVIEAEEAVGHEFNDADDLAMGLAGLVEMGAREAVITRDAGCVAIVDDGGRHALPGGDRAARTRLGGRLGRLLPGRLRRRPIRGGIAARMPRLRGRLRRGVDPALRRRQPQPARGRSAASPGSRSAELEVPAGVS